MKKIIKNIFQAIGQICVGFVLLMVVIYLHIYELNPFYTPKR